MRGLQAKERHVAPLESTAVEIVLRMNDTNIIIYIDVYIYIISSWPLGAIYIYIYMYYIVMASWCNKLLVGLLIPAFFTRCFPGRGNSFWERVSRMFPLPCTSSSRNACCTKRTCYLRSPKAQTSPRLGHKSDIVKCSNPKRPVKIT